MAQTQTKKASSKKRSSSSNSRSSTSKGRTGSSSTRSRSTKSPNGRSTTSRGTTSRGTASRSGKSRSTASRNGRSTATSPKGGLKERAQSAADGVTDVAKKGKTALLAGGAAAAGMAATVLVTRRANRRTKVLGVSLPKSLPRRNGLASKAGNLIPGRSGISRDTQKLAGKVTEAADRADKMGKRVSSVATGVKHVSETAKEAAKKA
jgi:hypothetical protein